MSHTSQIDESLFGKPNSEKRRQEILQDKWTSENAPIEDEALERNNNRSGKIKNKKEVVQLITKDLIRNLM